MEPLDAGALVDFYNGLSAASKRTFRPLGATTTLEVCEGIVRDNSPGMDRRLDLVALHETRIVGWAFLQNLQSDKPTFGLGIADDHQGRGLGGALMDRVMNAARERAVEKVSLIVVKDNAVAWKMYEKRGFHRSGEYVEDDGLTYFRMTAGLQPGRQS